MIITIDIDEFKVEADNVLDFVATAYPTADMWLIKEEINKLIKKYKENGKRD